MKTHGVSTAEHYGYEPPRPGTLPVALQPGHLYLVGAHELRELRQALAGGALPPDFEAKLARLAEGDLMHRFLARNCRLFVALLLAAQDGWFKEASPTDCERLMRVLAYVRKDDDAIADYRIGGFMDDQQEVRAAMTELHPLLKSFKEWRLRHQVPGMWLHN
jgi:hypothetical protein